MDQQPEDHETAEAAIIRVRLEALIGEGRQRGLDDETLAELLLEAAHALQQGDTEVADLAGPG